MTKSSICYPALCGILPTSMNEQGAGGILHLVSRAILTQTPLRPGCNTSVSLIRSAIGSLPEGIKRGGAIIVLIDKVRAQKQRHSRALGRIGLTPAPSYVPRVMVALRSEGGAGVLH